MKTGFTHESQKSESVEWYTPPYIFDALGAKFDMDVCSPGAEIVPWIPAKKHLTLNENGLMTPWEGFVWCNPPYHRTGTMEWMTKFIAHRNGIALLFSRTDTKWFQALAKSGAVFCFLKDRVAFINGATGLSVKGGGSGSMLIGLGCGKLFVENCALGANLR